VNKPEEMVEIEDTGIKNSVLCQDEQDILLSKEWMVVLTDQMEKMFLQYHGPTVSDFNRVEQVNKILVDLIVKNLNCDLQLASTFVFTRLHMRLRDCNLPVRNASLNCSNKSYAKFYA